MKELTQGMTLESVMALLLVVAVHVVVVLAIIAMFVYLARLIRGTRRPKERFLRSAAFATGFLVFVGARAVGLSIPEMMAEALKTSNPFSVAFFGVLLPLGVGAAVAWFLLRLMRQHSDVSIRGLILFGALMLCMFADAYAVLAGAALDVTVKQLLPNITFVVGVVLYLIFNDTEEPSKSITIST